MVPLQNRMPLQEFVVASMPDEREFLEAMFTSLRGSGTQKDLWIRLRCVSVRHLTAEMFRTAYLNAADIVLATHVQSALTPYFKAGVVALLLRLE